MIDIQKRFDRILAIFMHLLVKPLVTARELADKYEVSPRTRQFRLDRIQQ